MNIKSAIQPFLVSIIPLGLIILNVLDLYDVLTGRGDYPFGSEFFGKLSIYASREIYIFYIVLFTLALMLTIFFAFKEKWRLFTVLILFDGLLFLYPFFTAG